MVEVRAKCSKCGKKIIITGPAHAAEQQADKWQAEHECRPTPVAPDKMAAPK